MSKMMPVIVIVEDDSALSKMYEERFKSEKFIVALAKDGDEAINKINLEKPDIILLDLMLPKRGGLGVLQILKTLPQTKNIPVIILTAYAQDEYKKVAQANGAVEFLSKSETMPVEVVKKVKEIIGWNK